LCIFAQEGDAVILEIVNMFFFGRGIYGVFGSANTHDL
jgi:hypothetical protein